MGGNRHRYEPSNCKEWKQKEEIWSILQKGRLTNYMERLHGRDAKITNFFSKKWRKGTLKMGYQTIPIDEDLIAQVMGLCREGSNFYKDKKLSKEAIERYPETTKEKKWLVKLSKTYYPLRAYAKPWRDFLFSIMWYITLDGRFTKVYGYHFVLLNHFKYDEKVNIPYILICSMNATIKAHRENPKGDTAMHQGLMVLIYDHLKSNQIACPQLSISDSEEEGSDSDFSMGDESKSDSKSEIEESLEEFEAELGKKRKQMSIKPSSSKGKKKRKEKVFQIHSSEEEVSEDFEKDEN